VANGRTRMMKPSTSGPRPTRPASHCSTAVCAGLRRLGGHPAHVAGGPKGPRHPQGVHEPRALGPVLPELWALWDLAEKQQHHDRRGGLVSCNGVSTKEWQAEPYGRHAALRHPRARHGLESSRHRAERPDPPVRRHVPDLHRLHAPAGPAGRRDATAHDLRVDALLDSASARTAPTHPPIEAPLASLRAIPGLAVRDPVTRTSGGRRGGPCVPARTCRSGRS